MNCPLKASDLTIENAVMNFIKDRRAPSNMDIMAWKIVANADYTEGLLKLQTINLVAIIRVITERDIMDTYRYR